MNQIFISRTYVFIYEIRCLYKLSRKKEQQREEKKRETQKIKIYKRKSK